MQADLLRSLRAHRAAICRRWEALLRVERVNTPLANPDALVYLFDRTLNEIFAELRHPHPPQPDEYDFLVGEKNPLFNYFVAAEQAVLEALILAQAEMPALDPAQRDEDFAQLKAVVRGIARRELVTLESVCHPPSLQAGAGI